MTSLHSSLSGVSDFPAPSFHIVCDFTTHTEHDKSVPTLDHNTMLAEHKRTEYSY